MALALAAAKQGISSHVIDRADPAELTKEGFDDRATAIETALRALQGARVEGVPTTIPLHLAVLASEEFQSGDYDTASLPGWSA